MFNLRKITQNRKFLKKIVSGTLTINLVLFIFSAKDVLADNSNPQVVMQTKGDIRELPKTGLPLAAWAFSSLLPAGFGIKKFDKKSAETNANSIWTERQMNS